MFRMVIAFIAATGRTMREDQPLRIVELITRTALHSVSKET